RTEVGAIELCVLVYLAGQKAGPQRTKRNEADAKFLNSRQDFRLRAPIKKRILTLDCCDRLHLVCTTDRLSAGLGKSEMLDLACLDQFLDRTGDILDRHVRVNTML